MTTSGPLRACASLPKASLAPKIAHHAAYHAWRAGKKRP